MDAARRGSARDWAIVAILTVAMILSFIDRFGISLLIEPIKQDLHVDDRQIGLLNGVAFGLFYAAMGMPLGWLADRWSRKGTIILGVAIWSVATSACGLAGSFTNLLIARIWVGAGEASLAPAGYSTIHDHFPRSQLSRALSVFQIGGYVGSGLAMIVAGAIYSFFVGHRIGIPFLSDLRPWQQTFIALGAPGVLLLALLSLIPKAERAPLSQAAGRPDWTIAAALRARAVPYALLFGGMSGLIVTVYGCLTWVPAILTREFGWTTARIGATYGMIILIAAPLGVLSGGWLTDLLVRRGDGRAHAHVALLSSALGLPLIFLLTRLSSASAILALLSCLHFVLCLAIASSPALIQIITPREARGQVSALYVLIVNVLGLGVGPTLIGSLSAYAAGDPHGLRSALGAVALPALLCGTVLLALLCRQPATPADD